MVTGAGVRVLLGRVGGCGEVEELASLSCSMSVCAWASVCEVAVLAAEVRVEGVAGLEGTESGTYVQHRHRHTHTYRRVRLMSHAHTHIRFESRHSTIQLETFALQMCIYTTPLRTKKLS